MQHWRLKHTTVINQNLTLIKEAKGKKIKRLKYVCCWSSWFSGTSIDAKHPFR